MFPRSDADGVVGAQRRRRLGGGTGAVLRFDLRRLSGGLRRAGQDARRAADQTGGQPRPHPVARRTVRRGAGRGAGTVRQPTFARTDVGRASSRLGTRRPARAQGAGGGQGGQTPGGAADRHNPQPDHAGGDRQVPRGCARCTAGDVRSAVRLGDRRRPQTHARRADDSPLPVRPGRRDRLAGRGLPGHVDFARRVHRRLPHAARADASGSGASFQLASPGRFASWKLTPRYGQPAGDVLSRPDRIADVAHRRQRGRALGRAARRAGGNRWTAGGRIGDPCRPQARWHAARGAGGRREDQGPGRTFVARPRQVAGGLRQPRRADAGRLQLDQRRAGRLRQDAGNRTRLAAAIWRRCRTGRRAGPVGERRDRRAGHRGRQSGVRPA